MKRIARCKRMLLYLCLLFLVCSGCFGRLERSGDWMDVSETATAMLRQSEVHAVPLDFLCDGQGLSSEEALSQTSSEERKLLYLHGESTVFVRYHLLTGLAVLSVILSAGIFHDSSSQTIGLGRLIAFIYKADGTKEPLSFSLHKMIKIREIRKYDRKRGYIDHGSKNFGSHHLFGDVPADYYRED